MSEIPWRPDSLLFVPSASPHGGAGTPNRPSRFLPLNLPDSWVPPVSVRSDVSSGRSTPSHLVHVVLSCRVSAGHLPFSSSGPPVRVTIGVWFPDLRVYVPFHVTPRPLHVRLGGGMRRGSRTTLDSTSFSCLW